MKHRPKATSEDTLALEESLRQWEQPGRDYVLQLYITGMTARSAEALTGIKEICEKYLRGHYDLEVIDLYQHPALAKDAQIIAAPTLIKRLPEPVRRLVGNLSEVERVLSGLGLHYSR